MTNLTPLEITVLVAFINEGADCTGAGSAEAMKEDNMSWMSAPDLVKATGLGKHTVSGVMSALQDKGLIMDSGESARGARQTDWYATNKGIDTGWTLIAQ
jgi:hypothetical protein